ncbi:MAG: hypothetical protein JST93_23565 [Acidobacteria bacterium]|nr:hypothetical protein [Acidobacteriota bacterium]
MNYMEGRKPPKDIYEGELGEELMILSLPVIRTAERLETSGARETADGKVKGDPGDFLVKSETNELYPIRDRIFYGTYQILGRVGAGYICRRQLHVRRAWEAISEAGVNFHYQPNRGSAHGDKGSWVYQCDDDDFGLINAKEKEQAHIRLGTVQELTSISRAEDVYRTSWLIALLPPLLTLIAILAYTKAIEKDYAASGVLLACEAILLLGGIFLVWQARRRLWFFKAAMRSTTEIATEFHLAARMLGQKPSAMFPSMALWRAAQMKPDLPPWNPADCALLKQKVFQTVASIAKQTHNHHKQESWANWLTWITAALIVACIGIAIPTHSRVLEVIAILMPSIVTSVHAYLIRRQTLRRIDAGRTFLSELRFIGDKLNELTPGPESDPAQADKEEYATVLRLLCKAVAEHTQRELEFALREEPNLPL